MASPAHSLRATAEDAGRSCPYCRFPIKEEAAVVVCSACGAPHHGECWDENGGCAVVACSAGPHVSAQAALAVPVAVPASPEPRPPRRSRRWVAVTAGAVALSAIGAAAAVMLIRHPASKPAASAPPAPVAVTTVVTRVVSTVEHAAVKKKAKPTAASAGATGAQGRYAVEACGAIIDRSTGLEWRVGPDQETSWPAAQSWVAGLTACGGGWQMPTAAQLQGLFDPSASAGTGFYTRGRYYPAHINAAFSGIGGGSWVWTDTPVSASTAAAVNLYEDLRVTLQRYQTVYSVRAFAVRRAP
jgi:hypothetical protein